MSGNSAALDTNVAVQILNDVQPIVQRLANFDELGLPVPVIGELRYGALNSARAAENIRKVDQLVTRCVPLGTDVLTAEVYARLRSELRRKGSPIPENDLWIAAICVQQGIELATHDHHFTYVDGLRIVSL